MKDPFVALHDISKQTALLSSIESHLDWDQNTYLPPDAVALRSQQLEWMAHLVHKSRTSSSFVKALSRLVDIESGEVVDSSLSAEKIAALREWRRDYLHLSKLPSAFVKKFTKITATAQHVWAKAKKEDSFSLFAPHLEKIVSLCRKKADLLGFKEHPYDALLDLFEPELTTSFLIPLFTRLKPSLTALLKKIHAQPVPDTSFLEGNFPHGIQMQFGHLLMKAMGLNPEFCRLDESVHPFCSGMHPTDIRMTTRIVPSLLVPHIFSVIHEGGHALYERGLPESRFGSPLGQAVSCSIHESQSRFWETLLGRSFPFWRYFYPVLQEYFPSAFQAVSIEDFYKAINKVKPSLIRVEADEVTYSLHIIVRFEIEKALLEGALKVSDIPDAWNEKMRTYLGISPDSNSVGCLQDIHWSMGALGYFPSYSLGNLYAAQFFETFERTHPHWKDLVAKGDLSFIREWLKTEIHQWGRMYTPQELVQKVTGKPLSEEPFVRYLEHKFGALYHLRS